MFAVTVALGVYTVLTEPQLAIATPAFFSGAPCREGGRDRRDQRTSGIRQQRLTQLRWTDGRASTFTCQATCDQIRKGD